MNKNKEVKEYKKNCLSQACIAAVIMVPLIFIYLLLMPSQYADSDVELLGSLCMSASIILAVIAAISYVSNKPSIIIVGTLFYMVMDFLLMIKTTNESVNVFLIFYIALLAIVLILASK